MHQGKVGTSKFQVINSITTPLGFFVLALLIVEAYLGTVIVGSNLAAKDKLIGMWTGVALFVVVVGAVFYLVCFRPQISSSILSLI